MGFRLSRTPIGECRRGAAEDVPRVRNTGFETDLEGVAQAYAAMDERRAIKSLLRVGTL